MKQWLYTIISIVLLLGVTGFILHKYLHTGQDVADTTMALKALDEMITADPMLTVRDNKNIVMMRVRHGWVELCIRNTPPDEREKILSLLPNLKARIQGKDLHIVFSDQNMKELSNVWLRDCK